MYKYIYKQAYNNYKAATNNIISYIVFSSPYHLLISNLYLKLE